MAGSFVVGTRVRINGTFADATGALFDPATLTLAVMLRQGARQARPRRVYTYGVDGALVRASLGKFYLELLLDAPGTVQYRWQSAGEGEESVLEGQLTAVAQTF